MCQGEKVKASVDSIIANLRLAVSAKTNAELARKLGIDQSTISSWRARGRVPERFRQMLNAEMGPPAEPPKIWGDLQDRATALALVRFTILRQEIAISKNIETAFGIFMDLKPFWLLVHRAVHELRLKMENLGVDLPTAQALLMQDDLHNPDTTKRRLERELSEDISDNPYLSHYK